jgi:hypothetical protein
MTLMTDEKYQELCTKIATQHQQIKGLQSELRRLYELSGRAQEWLDGAASVAPEYQKGALRANAEAFRKALWG